MLNYIWFNKAINHQCETRLPYRAWIGSIESLKNLFKTTIRSRIGHHQSAVRTQSLSSAARLKGSENPRSTRAQSTGSSQYVAENYVVLKEDDKTDGGRQISGSPNCPFLDKLNGKVVVKRHCFFIHYNRMQMNALQPCIIIILIFNTILLGIHNLCMSFLLSVC